MTEDDRKFLQMRGVDEMVKICGHLEAAIYRADWPSAKALCSSIKRFAGTLEADSEAAIIAIEKPGRPALIPGGRP